MAQVDFNERQITLKLVYYGPPLSGKTTNLKSLHTRVEELNRGRLMMLDTRDDRTLFFDLLPIFFKASGLSFRMKVYTVPGQPMHEATRRVVLQGSDGVVFVADSSPAQAEANRTAWLGLARHLGNLGLERIPVVIQYNKRDLDDAIPVSDADRFGTDKLDLFTATALRGDGVITTFFGLLDRVWDSIDADMQLGQRFGISRASFRDAVCAHVGAEPRDILTR
ncbi:MAG TPA: GTPase domain-containing protein [Kofleriaceae bacterium]|nr:GTPase domain-containing protein [Kofleriaceae bacterium]